MFVVTAVMVATAACLPDPQRAQVGELLDQLSAARAMFAERPPRVDDGCVRVGGVLTRLYGEPGLVNVPSAWEELRDAADALNAACGQARLLAQPSTESPAVQLARQRWQQGIQREISVACDHLRTAAASLERPAPC